MGREVPRKTSDRGIYANLATATLGSVAINSIRFLAHRQTHLCCRRPLANSALPAFSDLYHFGYAALHHFRDLTKMAFNRCFGSFARDYGSFNGLVEILPPRITEGLHNVSCRPILGAVVVSARVIVECDSAFLDFPTVHRFPFLSRREVLDSSQLLRIPQHFPSGAVVKISLTTDSPHRSPFLERLAAFGS